MAMKAAIAPYRGVTDIAVKIASESSSRLQATAALAVAEAMSQREMGFSSSRV